MFLNKVTIDSFRTLTAPQDIEIDPKMTVLIGANESGKTNLLQAIQCLSLTNNLQPEDISKCKRRKYAKKELPTVSYQFSLSQEAKGRLSELISALSGEDSIIIRKKGNGIEGYSLAIPRESIMKKLLIHEKELETSLHEIEKKKKRTKKLLDQAKSKLGSVQATLRRGETKGNRTQKLRRRQDELSLQLKDLKSQLDQIVVSRNNSRKRLAEIQDLLKKPRERKLSIPETEMSKLINLLPHVLYIKDLDYIPESIPIAEVITQKTPKSIAVGNLLKIGDIEDLTILNETPRRLRPLLRGVAGVVSDKLSEVWKQEPLVIELTKEGANLVISVNEKVAISSPPQERSEGFQWFLSFFANFAPKLIDQLHGNIILLDEPAIRLHPEGQKNLLAILEKISEKNQVIYTSHSPFLINRNFPQRIRLLTKEPESGTLINNKPYSNGKTRFWEPLKSAIGVCLGDLFSLGETNLIVEGISDQILITGISNKLAKINATYLDLEKITIVPAMGALCVAYLAKFAVSEGLKTIALFDSDAEGKKVVSKLKNESKIIVKSVDGLKSGAVTIEDLVPRDRYIEAVNSFYSKIGIVDYEEYPKPQETEGKKLKTHGLIQELDSHFEAMGYSLNKVSVAKELIQQLDINEEDLPKYKSFVTLFDTVNKAS